MRKRSLRKNQGIKSQRKVITSQYINNSLSEHVHTAVSSHPDPMPEVALTALKSLCRNETTTQFLVEAIIKWREIYPLVFDTDISSSEMKEVRQNFLKEQFSLFREHHYKIGSTHFDLCHILYSNPESGLRLCAVVSYAVDAKESILSIKNTIDRICYSPRAGLYVPSSPKPTRSYDVSNIFKTPKNRDSLGTSLSSEHS